MATSAEVLKALQEVYDPEIGINVVDLGLIYGVDVQDDRVSVQMTLTTPGCPMHRVLGRSVEVAIRQLPGVKDARVEMVWEPRWTPERLSPEARRQLGLA